MLMVLFLKCVKIFPWLNAVHLGKYFAQWIATPNRHLLMWHCCHRFVSTMYFLVCSVQHINVQSKLTSAHRYLWCMASWHKHTNHVAPSGLGNLTELQIFLQPHTNLPPASGINLAALEVSQDMVRREARNEIQGKSFLAARRGIVLNCMQK